MKLTQLYQNREEFIIIGLTGRTGAGCSTVSKWFSVPKTEFDNNYTDLENPNSNDKRKYKICYDFLKQKWEPFYILKYSKVLSWIAYKEKLENFDQLFENAKIDFDERFPNLDFKQERIKINSLKANTTFTDIKNLENEDKNLENKNIFNFFQSTKFNTFHTTFQNSLKCESERNRIIILHTFCNQIRKGGCFSCPPQPDLGGIYTIAEDINKIIKGYKKQKKNEPCRVIIDSFRNPFEIIYFRERYSAFYSLAVNPDEDIREKKLKKEYGDNYKEIVDLDNIEYGDKNNRKDFFKQNVQQCIQMSDLHLSFLEETKTYPFTITQQIVIFYSLMLHPGLVTPSSQERCMQIAYTAKYNSGCISRQVGAVITDKNYSIKSIGWNNTPEKQTPCLLRNAHDFFDSKETEGVYSYYERTDDTFLKELKKYFDFQDSTKINSLEGLHCAYCFKDIQNSIKEGKNQVHTRSLHAEENAMLQLTKYGGQGIEGGYLFTTASPCELCSKKAYQLGINRVYYIDPYPGISKDHILHSGSLKIKLVLFTGAIGKAYHKLYEPFMAHKDEIYIRTDIDVKDKLKQLQARIAELEKENKQLQKNPNSIVGSDCGQRKVFKLLINSRISQIIINYWSIIKRIV
ncbi:deoxycytidylate deaminase [Bacteroidia bacterium]|nr:deoxycytidylate deaminase [Bacteroidia bacterium]